MKLHYVVALHEVVLEGLLARFAITFFAFMAILTLMTIKVVEEQVKVVELRIAD
jgi:hypothetical protein